MRKTIASLFFAVMTAPAFAIEFTPSDDGRIEFDMPSRNICCSYNPNGDSGANLSCTRVQPKYWIIDLHESGQLTTNKNVGEVPGCGYGEPLGNVFSYGTSWSMDGFKCTSASTGLKCMKSGKGFKLNRKGLVEYD